MRRSPSDDSLTPPSFHPVSVLTLVQILSSLRRDAPLPASVATLAERRLGRRPDSVQPSSRHSPSDGSTCRHSASLATLAEQRLSLRPDSARPPSGCRHSASVRLDAWQSVQPLSRLHPVFVLSLSSIWRDARRSICCELGFRPASAQPQSPSRHSAAERRLHKGCAIRPDLGEKVCADRRAAELRCQVSKPRSKLSKPRSKLSKPHSKLSKPRSKLSKPRSKLSKPRSKLSKPRSRALQLLIQRLRLAFIQPAKTDSSSFRARFSRTGPGLAQFRAASNGPFPRRTSAASNGPVQNRTEEF